MNTQSHLVFCKGDVQVMTDKARARAAAQLIQAAETRLQRARQHLYECDKEAMAKLVHYEQQDERFREATGWSIRYMHEREFRKIALIHSLDDYRMRPEYLDHLVEDMKELMESYKKIIKQLNDLTELKV